MSNSVLGLDSSGKTLKVEESQSKYYIVKYFITTDDYQKVIGYANDIVDSDFKIKVIAYIDSLFAPIGKQSVSYFLKSSATKSVVVGYSIPDRILRHFNYYSKGSNTTQKFLSIVYFKKDVGKNNSISPIEYEIMHPSLQSIYQSCTSGGVTGYYCAQDIKNNNEQ